MFSLWLSLKLFSFSPGKQSKIREIGNPEKPSLIFVRLSMTRVKNKTLIVHALFFFLSFVFFKGRDTFF